MPLPPELDVPPDLQAAHKAAISTVSARLKHFHYLQKPYRIYHGSTNSTRASNKTVDNVVDTSSLDRVLSVTSPLSLNNDDGAFVLTEPNVSMSSLVAATLDHGLVPPVVMEFPAITAGGGFAGTSAESSSFRHGVFDRTVEWIEIVLPNGEVVAASSRSDDPRKDLYEGAASSFGTLGVVTCLKIKLVRAKQYVKCEYVPFQGMNEGIAVISRAFKDQHVHFIDGIVYGRDQGVVILGSLASRDELGDTHIRTFRRRRDPWFYLHVQRLVFGRSSRFRSKHLAGHRASEAIPLRDYLFRYDRAGFWVARYAFSYFATPFNRITRTVLDPFLHAATMYHALHKSGLADSYLMQDVAVPLASAQEFMPWVDKRWGCYPVWLCPLNMAGPPPLFHRSMLEEQQEGRGEGLMLNFGVWGPASTDYKEHVQLNRDFEQEVRRLGGQKCLYAHAYYTEDEFWQIYGKERYDALRKKYHADWLPNVFDKLKVDLSVLDENDAQGNKVEKEVKLGWTERARKRFWATWPMMGLYGVAHLVIKKDYVIRKK